MDPLSALSITASLVQFIDFGSRLLTHTREIYHSAKGQTEETVELSTVASDLSELSHNIKAQSDSLRKASPAQGSSEEKLLRVCLQCQDVSQALEDALDQLRLKDVEAASGTKLFYFGRKIEKHLNSFFLALREVWAAKEMNAWRDLLSRLREELTTALLAVLWEKSQQTSKDMGEMSGQLETVLTTLRNVEGTTRSLNDSLVQQLANPLASSGTPKHAALIDAVWSSAWSSSTVTAVTKTYSPTEDELYFDVSEHDDKFCGNAITESLRFRSSDARETAIPNAYQQTYKWIFEKPQEGVRNQSTWSSFVSWLEEPSTEIYWVTGKPGAGKSTLMKFIVEHPDLRDYLRRWSDLSGKPLVLASFYFWNAGPLQMQKSQQGLLRILLAQCISQIPALAAKVCPRRWALLKIFGPQFVPMAPAWTMNELLESFSLLSLLAGDKINLALFIDGLDEFDGQHDQLMDFIKLLHRQPGTNICVSSRPWNVFLDALDTSPKLRMENLTSDDIVLYVNGQFQSTRGFQELKAHLPTEASRLVSVVVLLLREGLTEGDTISDLQKVLETLPSDLEELYQSIWDTIKPQYVGHASRLFQIHQVSTTTLDVVTFWLADEDNALSEDINVLKDRRRLHIFQIMRRRLNSRTRGLLEISVDGTVDYLHRTVRDWIVPLWNVILSKSPPGFDPHLAMLKALAIEVSNSSYWGEGLASMSFEFWGRVSLCFYHAASTKDLQQNLPLLVQVLDRMDADLDTVSKTCVYPNGASPLYRNTASASMNLSLKHAAPPHWSTSQYTQTEGSFDNTFVGLAAQFAVLPYVREKINRNPALLHHSTSTHSILSCAILGFRYFSRPDIADITDIAAFSDEEIFAVRIELVRLLLGKGALALQPKESQYFPRDMPTREEIRKNAEIYRTICQQGDEIAASEYWNKVGELFDGQMEKERESLVKGQKRPFLSRLFKKKAKK